MWRSSPSAYLKNSLNEYNMCDTGVCLLIHVNIGTYWHVGHVRKCSFILPENKLFLSLDINWNLVGGGIHPQSVNSCFFSLWSELIFHSHNVKLMSRWEGGNSVVSKPKHSRWRVPTSDITLQRVLNFLTFTYGRSIFRNCFLSCRLMKSSSCSDHLFCL